MAKRVGVDKWLFFTTLSLVLVGLAMVFSASAVMAQTRFGSPYTFLGRQALWALLGVIAMVALMRVDYRLYNKKKFIYPAMAVTVLLLLAAFVMPGSPRDSSVDSIWALFYIPAIGDSQAGLGHVPGLVFAHSAQHHA